MLLLPHMLKCDQLGCGNLSEFGYHWILKDVMLVNCLFHITQSLVFISVGAAKVLCIESGLHHCKMSWQVNAQKVSW